jgi:hypothetical protein
MVHGGSIAARLVPVADEAARACLEWKTIGPWTYGLGRFGVLKGFGGFAPWAVYIDGRLYRFYRLLGVARIALETAALAAGYEVVR